MTNLRELVTGFEANLDELEDQVETEGDHLVQEVDESFHRFEEGLKDVVQRLDSAFQSFVSDGLEPCQEELFEASTSMAVVGNNCAESRPLIEELAICKRVATQIVESFDESAG